MTAVTPSSAVTTGLTTSQASPVTSTNATLAAAAKVVQTPSPSTLTATPAAQSLSRFSPYSLPTYPRDLLNSRFVYS